MVKHIIGIGLLGEDFLISCLSELWATFLGLPFYLLQRIRNSGRSLKIGVLKLSGFDALTQQDRDWVYADNPIYVVRT